MSAIDDNRYKQASLRLLQNPSQFGGANEAFERLIFWAERGGFTLGMDDSILLRNLEDAIKGDELAKFELGKICVRLDASLQSVPKET